METASHTIEEFYKKVEPVKITETRKLSVDSVSWSAITNYYLEFVKILNYKSGLKSSAIIKIGDRSGQVTCLFEGDSIAILFGCTIEKWREITSLCKSELFYRNFNDGLSENFRLEQRLFYYFCQMNQRKDLFFVKFKRCVNMRKCDVGRIFLHVIDVENFSIELLELYLNYISCENEDSATDNITDVFSELAISESGNL